MYTQKELRSSGEQSWKIEDEVNLTTKQAARLLGLSVSTLNKWRCYGTGPRFLKLGRAVRYRKMDLRSFLEARQASNTVYQRA